MLGIYGTVYNSADTVRQTIEDLKSKLKEDFIIVVTDNFSTDGTYEILKEYDFIDVLRIKSTRGMGRQKALEHLIKNYKEVDLVFYIDFDVKFKDFFDKALKEIKKRYNEDEIYNSFGFGIASYNTYKRIVKKVVWPDKNLGEDFYWLIKLLDNKFKIYNLAFSLCINQIRLKREKKYSESYLKYIKRFIKNYFSFYIYTGTKLFEFLIKNKKTDINLLDETEYLFPEDLNIDKKELFVVLRTSGKIPHQIKEKLPDKKVNITILRSKSRLFKYVFIYRDIEKVKENLLSFWTALK